MALGKHFFPKLNIKPEINTLAAVAEGEKIPKIIHQTFPSKLLPQAIQANIDKIKAMNPEWEYRLYDDTDIIDFIKNNYDSRILDYFNRINPIYGAAKADLFRYLLIYKYGGVYIDIKSSLNKPLREVLEDNDIYLISGWRNKEGSKFAGWGLFDDLKNIANGEFQQWHIVAAPGHPFLKATIENVLRNIENYNPILHGVGHLGVLRVTGPIAYTLAIAPLLHLHKHRLVDSESDMGFEYSIFPASKIQSPKTLFSHKALFKYHYSDLREPIIKRERTNNILALAIKISNRIRGIMWRLKKFRQLF